MSIDFYEQNQLRLAINERHFSSLSDSIIVLQQQTGTFVDAYGKTTLTPNHARLWRDALVQLQQQTSDALTRQTCTNIIATLNAAIHAASTLTIIGE